MAQIGFIGLGHMGLPMANNLLKAGHKVSGLDLQEAAVKTFVELGGNSASSAYELVTSSDVVITMLQTGEQVKSLCLGGDGIFANLHKSSLFIDCSSIDVATSKELHTEASNNSIKMLEAPVSGGVLGAKAGTLTFMVGGELENYTRAESILSQMGKKIIYTGGPGSGQAAKICNNMILGISMIAISEAFILAEKLGLSREKLFEVVNNSSGQCWAMSKYVPLPGILDNVPAENDYEPGFAAAMMLKDLKLSQESAESVATVTPLGNHATKLYEEFIKEGNENLDFSAIIKLISRIHAK